MTEPATAALRDWPCTNADHHGLCSADHVHADHVHADHVVTGTTRRDNKGTP